MAENIDEIDVSEFVDEEGLGLFLDNLKGLFTPQARTINGKALTDDVSLVASDVGAFLHVGGTQTDLDELTSVTGCFRFTTATANKPITTGGWVFVLRYSNTYIYQVAFSNQSAGIITIHIRLHTASGWGAWTRLAI